MMAMIAFIYLSISLACAEKTLITKESIHQTTSESNVEVNMLNSVKPERKNRSYEDWFARGVEFSNEGRYEEAKNAFKDALKKRPHASEAHYRLGLAYKELGNTTYALRAIEQSLSINPDYADAHINLGILYQKLGRHKDALSSFRNAVRLNPNDANAHLLLGEASLEFRMKNEAKEALMKAVTLLPDFAEAHYRLGTVHIMLNDIPSALNEYEILIKLDRQLAHDLFDQIYE